MRPLRTSAVASLVLAALPLGAGQSATPTAFPRASARILLEAAAPPPAQLEGRPAAPPPATVAAATARLRRLAALPGSTPAVVRVRALAALVLGTAAAHRNDVAAALPDLETAATWPPIRDAATAESVALLSHQKDYPATLAAAGRFPPAPQSAFYAAIARAATLAAGQTQQWPDVLRWSDNLSPTAELLPLRAEAFAATGNALAAGRAWRDLVFRFPASSQAAAAESAWRVALSQFPELTPDAALYEAQARAWQAAGNGRAAAASWSRAADLAPASARPALEANEARAWLSAGDTARTDALCQALAATPEQPQAIEIELELARRQRQPALLQPDLDQLQARFAADRWRARALHEAADEALIDADDDRAANWFGELARDFPQSEYAPAAAWQSAWAAYRAARPDAPALLEQILTQYPNSGNAVDALYWRGRWADTHGQPALAQACYRAAADHFPGAYFGLQAAARMRATAGPLPQLAWLRAFDRATPTPHAAPLAPSAQTSWQQDTWQQAELLRGAGLDVAAATVLRQDLAVQPRGAASLTAARELAAIDTERGDAYAALVAMLHAVPDYLELRPAQLPRRDWLALFPAPFAPDLDAVVRRNGLDRDLLLGLMRQESAFDPRSLSSAHARGLMQLELDTARGHFPALPAAWRGLAGPGPLTAPGLFNPGLNIALGAAELRDLLREFGSPAYALAAYDAGPNRVVQWRSQFGIQPADEFIETIPFGETRDYVQAVLRNQVHYQRLYR